MPFDSLSEILRLVQSKYPKLSKRIVEAGALSLWEKAVGPAIAKHTRALRVQEGVLWIEVDHPIWKSELHYRKKQILDRLNSAQKDENSSNPPISDLFLVDRQ
ncbi:DUF721 domain-containing protein [bacterium]|nr:DUF721 domain-containing protein [bacterium]